jgi:hypothetical protein
MLQHQRRTIDNFDDAFDEEGLLKDGHVARTRMMARDSRDRPPVHDGRGGEVNMAGHRPGFLMTDASRRNCEIAYQQYENDLTNAWRDQELNPPVGFGSNGPRGQQEGDLCTINGFPGHLRRNRNGDLVCAPDRQGFNGANDPERAQSDGANAKEAAYRAYDAALANAWRGNK